MTDVDRLEAGPELDALVAEKVMGWKVDRRGLARQCRIVEEDRPTPMGGKARSVFSPSTKIADAYEVVLHLQKALEEFEVGFNAERGNMGPEEWKAYFSKGEVCYATTAPLAICRAALKAVGA